MEFHTLVLGSLNPLTNHAASFYSFTGSYDKNLEASRKTKEKKARSEC